MFRTANIIFLIMVSIAFLISCKNKNEEETDLDLLTKIKKGEELVTVARCNDCHTPYVKTKGSYILDRNRLLSGHPENIKITAIPQYDPESDKWIEFLYSIDSTTRAGEWGVSFAANLTPDKETGLGKWTNEQFINAIRTGMTHGNNILQPMPWSDYAKLSDDELSAIYYYLRSLKPVKNKVPESILFE